MMERAEIVKIAFLSAQLAVFAAIFGLQFYYGTGLSFISEWIKAIWGLVIAVFALLSFFVRKFRDWVPWLKEGWKIAIGIAIAACFGFRGSLTDIRTILSFALLCGCIAYFVVCMILPETRPNLKNERIEMTEITLKSPSEEEIKSFNQNQVKYQQIDELPENLPQNTPNDNYYDVPQQQYRNSAYNQGFDVRESKVSFSRRSDAGYPQGPDGY